MQDYYNQNYDRVQEELEYNKEEIRLYKGRLEIYKKLYETYFERKKVLDEYIAMNRENMRRIAELCENVEKVEKETDYHFDKVVKGTIRFIPNEPEDDTSRWIKVSNDGFVTAYRCGIGKGCFAVRSWTAKNVQDWLDGNTETCYDRAVWL